MNEETAWAVMSLREQLEAVTAKLRLDGGTIPFLLRHGRTYRWSPLPKGIRKGRAKACYRNAFILAVRDPSLTYVEGMIGPLITHAWCVTAKGEVVDNTPVGGLSTQPGPSCEYFGVPFQTEWLRRTVFEKLNGRPGIFPELWKLDLAEITEGIASSTGRTSRRCDRGRA